MSEWIGLNLLGESLKVDLGLHLMDDLEMTRLDAGGFPERRWELEEGRQKRGFEWRGIYMYLSNIA